VTLATELTEGFFRAVCLFGFLPDANQTTTAMPRTKQTNKPRKIPPEPPPGSGKFMAVSFRHALIEPQIQRECQFEPEEIFTAGKSVN